jgi:hypothetical protein
VTTITEGALAFEFPNQWVASKYDDWIFFGKHFKKLQGTKAVDIVAIHANQRLWLIEIKDYRAEPRQKAIEFAEEVALKARDTLAGLMAAQLLANDIDEARIANRAVRCIELKVVLHLEQPIKTSRLHPVEDVSLLLQKLKQLLRAIDPHPRVTNLADGNRFGWDVREV